jgi:hypothetical protein
MYSAVDFKYEEPGTLHKVLFEGCQEKVIVNHSLALLQLVLGTIKVIVHKQVFQELSNGV